MSSLPLPPAGVAATILGRSSSTMPLMKNGTNVLIVNSRIFILPCGQGEYGRRHGEARCRNAGCRCRPCDAGPLRPRGARRSAWRISASAPSTAATRPNTPTTSLERRFDRWGVVGINIRPPRLADTLGRQDGLYTRLAPRGRARRGARHRLHRRRSSTARPVPAPALGVLASPDIDAGDADGDREGLLPHAGERRARPRAIPTSSMTSPSPRAAAQPARPARRGRWSCAGRARPAAHAA